jgi:hypothetical protein
MTGKIAVRTAVHFPHVCLCGLECPWLLHVDLTNTLTLS